MQVGLKDPKRSGDLSSTGLALLVCIILLGMEVGPIACSLHASNELTWLHTEADTIVDEQGNLFVPRGAAVGELGFRQSLLQQPDQILSEMKNFGANAVRLAVNSAFWEKYPNYRSLIDDIARMAKGIGLYVVIDLHNTLIKPQNYNGTVVYADMQNPTAWIDFLVDVAERYKDNSAVLYCVLGQPLHQAKYFTHENDILWWNLALEIAGAMHRVNPRALLFIPTLDANSIRQYFIDNPWPEPNIVYVIHRYYHWDIEGEDYAKAYAKDDLSAFQKMEAFYTSIAFRMLQKGYPFNLIEFGATTVDPNWEKQITELYSLLNEYGVGYFQWVWYEPRPPFPGRVRPSWGLHLPDYTVSPQGEVWAQGLRRETGASYTTLTTSTVTSCTGPTTSTAAATAISAPAPAVPGFPPESILIGSATAALATLMARRRKRKPLS